MNRVVITGMGAITPCGNTVEKLWDNVSQGVSGIDYITKFDASNFKVKIAAEVKGFNPDDYMGRESKRMDLYCQYAVAASTDAVKDAGLGEDFLKGNNRAGVMVGSGIGGLYTLQEQIIKLHDKGPHRVAPLFIPMCITNMAAGHIAIKFGVIGINMAHVTACSSGGTSIGEAFRNIKHGYSDIILAGGAEAAVTEIGVAGFTELTALSESNDPKRGIIPFDKDRNGFVIGEGAGVLVLEELGHAVARGAKIYAEIKGYGANADAYHMTAPNPEGETAAAAMLLAMDEAGIAPEDVSYVNAHGTGTPHNDLPETIAIKLALGERAYHIPVSSTKSMTGHLLGAAGAVEAIICIKALENDFIPPTIGLDTPGEGCDLDYVKGRGRKREMKYTLSNSFAFGGHNAVLCMKKWEGK